MSPLAWWILVALVLLGHFGLHLAIYNRWNALGLKRNIIKLVEKLLFVEMLVTPLLAAFYYANFFKSLPYAPAPETIPAPLFAYGVVCLSSWVVFGVPWLLWRPIFGLEWAPTSRTTSVIDVEQTLGRSLARTRACRLGSKLPLNQIFELAVDTVELPVANLPPELDGYRIAQLSDVHLTGDIQPDFFTFVLKQAMRWQPELLALTGDIIDEGFCIDWLPQIFASAEAKDGAYFILGNHDTKVIDSWQTREAMDRAGWTDLGSRVLECRLRNVPSLLMGNEYPWYGRPTLSQYPAGAFRLLLSHSPDQITWARRNGVHLMLAGHTHGGQGRLPLAGPLLSPSLHGSRYASGDFYKPPTTMHVSRGLSGTHLMRINCRPELSLLTLRVKR